MAQKKWVIGVTAFLALSLVLAGLVAMAAETGSQGDPLASVSYLTGEFQPAIMSKIDELIQLRVDEYSVDMTTRINTLSTQVNSNTGGTVDVTGLVTDTDFISAVAAAVIEKMPTTSSGTVTASGWVRVDIKSGKTFVADLGTEIMLRLGSATCVASASPGLIDMTTGSDLANGKALEANHNYICTIAGRGFKATKDVTVFVRGSYTIN